MFGDRQQAALAVPFTGVRASDGVRSGLFPIRATGVSTEPIRRAAAAFVASLTPTQLFRTVFSVDDVEWRRWSNVDNGLYLRQGVSLKELGAVQREAAMALVRASLSARGLALTQAIMKTDETLREINDDARYDQELYFFTIMGQPSPTEPWGWQLEGHHLIINYFVLGDQVVMTPTFMGSEPVIATSGKYAGTRVLQDEQDKGLAFMRALTSEQQQKAVIEAAPKTANKAQGQAFRDNLILPYHGIKGADLSAGQKTQLLNLIGEYVRNMDDGHAKTRMEEVRSRLDDTHFAWIGSFDPDGVFYYRIHSPVILIEFDHQTPVALRGTTGPSRQHVHTVVRTPNGNDYGKDLLRQHYETHAHDPAHGHETIGRSIDR